MFRRTVIFIDNTAETEYTSLAECTISGNLLHCTQRTNEWLQRKSCAGRMHRCSSFFCAAETKHGAIGREFLKDLQIFPIRSFVCLGKPESRILALLYLAK